MHSESTTIDAHAPAASVTLDIGPGRGALVIYPGERFREREIEISRVGDRAGSTPACTSARRTRAPG